MTRKRHRLISSIRTHFDEGKTTAAAAVLLNEAGGRMRYLRLIKLLYLADRESWREFNRPITGDSYVAMRYGPVLESTFDLIKQGSDPSPDERQPAGPWRSLIEHVGRYDVRLKGEPDLGPLSEAEVEILKEAFYLYDTVDRWKLSELTHALKEWHDPGDSTDPIWPEDILQALGKTDEEVEEARQSSVEREHVDKILGT